MGREIVDALKASKKLKLVAEVARSHSGKQPGKYKKLDDIPKKPDVVIDFSLPAGFRVCAKYCEKNSVRLVSGTTGLTKADQTKLSNLAKKTPVLWASNMSLGIATVRKMIEALNILGEADIFLEDYHHKMKLDSPSGTAVTLAEDVKRVTGKKIDVQSVRAGKIYGIHRIVAVTDQEVVSIEHTALNRAVFAQGAVKAAEWIVSQRKKGLYQLSDVIS